MDIVAAIRVLLRYEMGHDLLCQPLSGEHSANHKEREHSITTETTKYTVLPDPVQPKATTDWFSWRTDKLSVRLDANALIAAEGMASSLRFRFGLIIKRSFPKFQ